MNALVKYLIDYSTFQLVFFRSLGSLGITFAVLKTQKIPVWGNQKRLLVYRGLVGVTSMILFFWGIHYISIGSAVTLRYVSPIFAGILAVLFLSEVIKPIQWLFFLMAFAGVYLIKSYDPSGSSFGVFLVLSAAFFSAGGLYFNFQNWKRGSSRGCSTLFYVDRYPCGRSWEFFFLEDAQF
jgi:drug/metabolite transporter (DMT)-like permease